MNVKNTSADIKLNYGHVPLSIFLFEAAHHTALYPTKTKMTAEKFSVVRNSTYPLPIYSRQFPHNTITNDPVTKLVRQKEKRDWDINYFKVRARKEGKNKLYSGESISTDTIKLIRAMEKDPDPNVQTHYDWHFYGGNLESLKIDEDDYLVQSSMRETKELKFHRVPDYENQFKYDDEQLSDLPGYEIIKNKNLNSVMVLAARFKDNLRFLKTNDMESEEFTAHIEWEEDIMSGSFLNSEFCFVDVTKVLTKFDLNLMKKNTRINLKNIDGNQNVKLPMTVGTTFDNNCILYTTRHSLSCIDFRSPFISNTIHNSENYLMRCEEISCQLQSSFDNLIYLSSSHMLYGIDVRHPKNPVFHWTHQIINQPSILKSVQHNNQEVICLASNVIGDLKIFNNGPGIEEKSWKINKLPFKPKNSFSTFNKCKDLGLFLFSDAITRHCTLSTAGIAMVSQSKLFLYTQNSIGDIFQSELIEDESVPSFSEKDVKIYQEWDESLTEEMAMLEQRKFPVTNYVNFRGLTRILKHTQNHYEELSNEDKDAADTSEFHVDIKPEWEIDIQQVKECKDVLAASMLSIWNVDHNIISDNPLDDLKDTKDKTAVLLSVSRWLNSTTVDGTQQSEMSIDDLTINHDISQIPDSQVTISQPVRASQIINKRVKGF